MILHETWDQRIIMRSEAADATKRNEKITSNK